MLSKIWNRIIKKWRFLTFILSLFIVFTILFLDFHYNSKAFDIWNYIQGVTTEFLGIIFTVLVIDFLYHKFRVENEKNIEKCKIKKLNIILSSSMIKTYHSALQLYCNNLLKTNQFDLGLHKFRDLKNAFNVNLLMDEGFYDKSYQVYYANHKILVDKIERILIEQRFEHNKNYTDLLESFLEDSLFDYKNEKGIETIDNNTKNNILSLSDLLNSDDCPDLLLSNIRNYLVLLYKSSQRFYRFFVEYNELISKL